MDARSNPPVNGFPAAPAVPQARPAVSGPVSGPRKRPSRKPASISDTMSEDDFQRRVMEAAKLRGWMCVHYRKALRQSGRVTTPVQGDKGGQDLILARAGVVILAELKRNGEYLKPEQKKWNAAAGAHARVWRPRDWDQVLAELSAPAPSNPQGKSAARAANCGCPMCGGGQ